MIFGLIARGIVFAIDAIQLAADGASAVQKFAKAVRQGKLKLPDETDPFSLTYKDVTRINQAAHNAGHESSANKGK